MAAEERENRIKLSIGILVSNRIETIRKSMESLKPLLEQIPSELIAIDTVGEGTDGSAQIVREYTDKVYFYRWCNDFADARNQCLNHAVGEWFLYLDDDEWFEDISEITDFFRSGEHRNYNSATYRIRNYKDFEGKEYSEAILGRMVKRTEKLCFVGRVHERFSEFLLPCKEFSAYVHHYGYVYRTEEERQAHIRRNQKLLRQELEMSSVDLHLRTQMALELATFDNKAALAFCEETFRLCLRDNKRAEFQWQLALVFRLYEALGVNCEEAERDYGEKKDKFGFSETAENAICYQMTRICLLQGQNVQAQAYAEKYFETYAFLEAHPREAQLQMAADFARYRAKNVYLEMLDFAAFSAWQAKKYPVAWMRYAQMPWDEAGYQNEDGLWKVFAMAEECADTEALFFIIQRCMKNEAMKIVLGKLMQNPAVKQRIAVTLEEQRRKQ